MEIKSTSDFNETGKLRFVVYGSSGAGKTKLISTLPGRVLILDTDKGLATIRKSNIDYVTATNWKEVKEFLAYLRTEECLKKYDFIVFDTLTAIFDSYMIELEEKEKKRDKPDKFNVYKQFLDFAMAFFANLRDQQNYHTLTLCQMGERENSDGITEKSYAIPGQARNRMTEFFDEVFALRVDKEGVRYLQTVSQAGYLAKDRSNVLDKHEPADLSKIIDKIKGK